MFQQESEGFHVCSLGNAQFRFVRPRRGRMLLFTIVFLQIYDAFGIIGVTINRR